MREQQQAMEAPEISALRLLPEIRRSDVITADWLNGSVRAINDIRRGTPPPTQSMGISGSPIAMYLCKKSADITDEYVDVRRVDLSGQEGDEIFSFPKGTYYKIPKGDICGWIYMANGAAIMYPIFPLRYLYFQQGADGDGESLDMPANGKKFWATHILDRDLDIPSIHIYSTAGTYSVVVYINGVAQSDTFTNAMTYPYTILTPYKYRAGESITLHVTTSSGVKGFEAILSMREGIFIPASTSQSEA